jgi:hypothetical protein
MYYDTLRELSSSYLRTPHLLSKDGDTSRFGKSLLPPFYGFSQLEILEV